ncbi:MAG: GNAT family N-acetyltransferase [Spirochaetes bacterium]|nr:GNAT family N-acetyltransferase [Spirochaetota bacterium]MBU0954722.1 GNAT family N-acetyltransferase [Spirochaetota bacterium]
MIHISQVEDRRDFVYNKFITELDNDFVPSLSRRAGGVDAFINVVFENTGIAWLACDGSEPVGSLSFWLNDDKIIYVWFIGIKAALRGTLLGGQIIMSLMSTALQSYEREKPGSAEGIKFTTWESNSNAIRLYQLLGFKIVGKKENDMVEGRTTLFFEGNFSLVRERLMRLTHGLSHK